MAASRRLSDPFPGAYAILVTLYIEGVAALERRGPMKAMTIDEIIDNFSLLDEWDDRYRYVIELGRALAPLDERDRNEANKVQGCASQVWLATTCGPNGAAGPVLTFVGDSDAHIVRGLIAILFAIYSGQAARDILATDAIELFNRIGTARASHAAALERLPLHGRAHQVGRARSAGARRRLASFAADASSNPPITKRRILREPGPHRRARRAARLGAVAVVAREPVEPELQHDLGRARRPAALALDIFEPFEEAADVEQQAGEFGPDRIERVAHALARRDDGFGEGRPPAAGAAAILRHRRRPVRRDARHELGAREIGAQPLAGLQLDRLDQRAAVAALAAREPGERALGRIDGDAGAARPRFRFHRGRGRDAGRETDRSPSPCARTRAARDGRCRPA